MSRLYKSILTGFKEIAEIENIPDLVYDIEKELSRINESIALDEDLFEPEDVVQVDIVDDQPVLGGPEQGEDTGVANLLTNLIHER